MPAILGSSPSFPEGLRFAKPLTPPLDAVVARLAPSYEAGQLTSGALVRELEDAVAERLDVRAVVAVNSCTSGLMLTLRSLGITGDVVIPSFTFAASAHAVAWNGLTPRFAECDPHAFQLDVADATTRVDGAGAILATHIFGAPAAAESLVALGVDRSIPVVFDAAHAFGATRAGRPIGGFGAAEVFSLSPTKLVVAGEGGIVATNDPDLAALVRLGRDYGNPGDYDMRYVGLNARMSELHAAVALESFAGLDAHLATRRALAARYVEGLTQLPGVLPQVVADGDESTYKDLTVIFDPAAFGLDREQVVAALRAEGIDTRRYFHPPIHQQQAYADSPAVDLPVTDDVADRVLSLPMFGELREDEVDRVVEVLADLHEHAEQIRAASAA